MNIIDLKKHPYLTLRQKYLLWRRKSQIISVMVSADGFGAFRARYFYIDKRVSGIEELELERQLYLTVRDEEKAFDKKIAAKYAAFRSK